MKKRLIIIPIVLVIILIFNLSNAKTIDNFYTYINKEEIASKEIEEGTTGWSKFTITQDKVDKEVDDIVEKTLIENKNSNIKLLYKELTDETMRNKGNLGILKDYIKLIDNAKNIANLLEVTYKIEEDLAIDILMTSLVSGDLKNTKENIIYLMPITFDFGASSYVYIDEDYSYYAALLKQYQIKLMKLYGYDTKKARDISSKLIDLEKLVSKNSKSMTDLQDVKSIYNIITKEELKSIYSNIDVDKYLEYKGLSNEVKFSLVDKGNYETFNSLLTEDNLDTLKEFIKLRVLEEYAPFITTDYAKLITELNNKLLGVIEEFDLEKNSKNIIKTYFNDYLEKEYVNVYFQEEKKEYIENMIKEIIEYYKEDIETIDWMSNETKKKALEKLDKMTMNVGYPNEFDIISENYKIMEDKTLLDNIIATNKYVYNQKLKTLVNNKKEWQLSLTTVNAYYNPQDNSINFPAAFAELIDLNDSYYENLGSVGTVIAHEITHAFDNNGAKFDAYGNLNNWWTNTDLDNFNKLKEKVIDYYSKYKILGINIDGEKTVGENIADLGSLHTISSICEKHNASKQEVKEMYTSYAKLWVNNYTDSYQKLLLLSDTHSPNEIRVNATLSSNDLFYDVFDIKKSDKMYKKSNERVVIW